MKPSLILVALSIILTTANAAPKPPPTPIASLPITITTPGTYYFISDMYYTPVSSLDNTAITVNSPGKVTIDLNGYTLSDSSLANNPNGIVIESSDVIVENGAIAGFALPMQAFAPSGPPSYISNIDIHSITFTGGYLNSLALTYVNNSIVRDCVFTIATAPEFFTAISDQESQTGNRYINDTFSGPTTNPIRIDNGDVPTILNRITPLSNSLTTAKAPPPKPAIPIASLPITITEAGTYYFASDMYFSPVSLGNSTAITVNSPNKVTIDLNGFTLTGPAQAFAGIYYLNPVGVAIESSNVTIKNGTISGFFFPMEAGSSHPISNLDIQSLTFAGGTIYSLLLTDVNNSVVRNCNFTESDATGIFDTSNQTGNRYINDTFGARVNPVYINSDVPTILHSITPE